MKSKVSAAYSAKAYAAANGSAPLVGMAIPRRHPTERDVQIEILYCGICHSDLHYTRNEWDALPASYPAVPGHEIVGRVAQVGSAVTKHKVGDLVGVGCLVDSDHTCPNCNDGLENFCPNLSLTFGSVDRHGTAPMTFGGYSDSIVVDDSLPVVEAWHVLCSAAPEARVQLRRVRRAGGGVTLMTRTPQIASFARDARGARRRLSATGG